MRLSPLKKRLASAPTDLLPFDKMSTTLRQIYHARGIDRPELLSLGLSQLLPASQLLGLAGAVDLLDQSIQHQKRILIIGDFDADGATSTALMVLVLRKMGALVDFLVPDRFNFGYGLTPEIVRYAIEHHTPDVIVTVDNGISSTEGVMLAQRYDIKVIITDHHLTTKFAPPAEAVVNPNQQGCSFPSKALAGVGVAFYVLASLATQRKTQGFPAVNLTEYLDLVALGTVADVAILDQNNRILVANGIQRIRQGHCRLGILALLDIAGKAPQELVTQDLGFILGPRINAAGRMEHMKIGIECLITDDPSEAHALALTLDRLNKERRAVEAEIKQEALQLLTKKADVLNNMALPSAIVLFEPTWHQGVIGIVAGRLKEQFHRPSIVFAPSDLTQKITDDSLIKGSARSIEGIHIRDAIERVANRYPELISHFGGHAMAAGLSLKMKHVEAFQQAFEAVIDELVAKETGLLDTVILTDGELNSDELSLQFAEEIKRAEPWGQGFPAPLFEGEFQVIAQKVLKEQHLKLTLKPVDSAVEVDAIIFNIDVVPWENSVNRVRVAYTLDINTFRGEQKLQLMLKHLEILD